MVFNNILFQAVIFGFIQVVTSAENSTLFTRINPTTCGPIRLSSGWVDTSRSSCAANCRTRYPQDCQSFMYNTSTKLCTPSKGLYSSYPLPSVYEGDLYYHQYPEFHDFTLGPTTINAEYFTLPLTYTDAVCHCQSFGANLFSPDKPLKLSTLLAFAIPRHYMWIGLDDIAEEGKFVWVKNGQQINDFYKKTVFLPTQPDNGYGSGKQDCVFIGELTTFFDDGKCNETKSYVCEKLL